MESVRTVQVLPTPPRAGRASLDRGRRGSGGRGRVRLWGVGGVEVDGQGPERREKANRETRGRREAGQRRQERIPQCAGPPCGPSGWPGPLKDAGLPGARTRPCPRRARAERLRLRPAPAGLHYRPSPSRSPSRGPAGPGAGRRNQSQAGNSPEGCRPPARPSASPPPASWKLAARPARPLRIPPAAARGRPPVGPSRGHRFHRLDLPGPDARPCPVSPPANAAARGLGVPAAPCVWGAALHARFSPPGTSRGGRRGALSGSDSAGRGARSRARPPGRRRRLAGLPGLFPAQRGGAFSDPGARPELGVGGARVAGYTPGCLVSPGAHAALTCGAELSCAAPSHPARLGPGPKGSGAGPGAGLPETRAARGTAVRTPEPDPSGRGGHGGAR